MQKIDNRLDIISKRLANLAPTLQVVINIPSLRLNYNYSSTSFNQTFHSASVGKLMTATLIFMLIEKSKINLETKIVDILNDDILEKLFVFKGIDYKKEVTIRQLINHTSGINDYFEGQTIDKIKFLDIIITDRNKIFTPLDLINFTRTHQNSVAKPGQKFLYSDTGYVLLGLIIEKITTHPFSRALDDYIFKPLNMENTGLCFYNKNFDNTKLAPVFLNKTEISKYNSLSCDFSGGGLYTTANDLTLFLKAFMAHKLINKTSIEQMEEFKYPFHRAMFYGLGLMQLRFEKFFFLLKNMPRLQGHLGILGVHAWYDKETKDTYVINVGSTKDMVKSFQYLINVINIIEKEKKQLTK
jgi:D-alanyl-D-alanine carboxypeptidase